MRRFTPLILSAVLAVGVMGCSSTKAALTRAEFAWQSEAKTKDNAYQQRRLVIAHIDFRVKSEVNRLKQVLAAQNARATSAPFGKDEVAKYVAANYTNYFNAIETLRTNSDAEYQKVETLYAEEVALAGGFRSLSAMSDAELTIAKQTADLALTEAIKTGNELWSQYQAAHPPQPVDSKGNHDTTTEPTDPLGEPQ